MARMSRQLRHALQGKIKKHVVLLFLLCIPFSVMAEDSGNFLQHGDELLTLVQSDALEAEVVALQENVSLGRSLHAHRTRSAHHREATKNIVRYI
ncbi:hypothetical protein F4167_00855 [Candidatus Poribacteria bacterium]|nr:hypothetical protein [Candidatus Poribacteria bacterium]